MITLDKEPLSDWRGRLMAAEAQGQGRDTAAGTAFRVLQVKQVMADYQTELEKHMALPAHEIDHAFLWDATTKAFAYANAEMQDILKVWDHSGATAH